MTERIDQLDSPTWHLQAGDAIVEKVVDELKNEPIVQRIFGDSIEPYMRMDFSTRELPALRIFNPTGRKDSITGYLTGEVKIDVIFPPNVRRAEMQRYPDLVVSMLMAQFTRPSFYATMRGHIPGLNELGRTFSYDKALGFIPKDSQELCPLTQITLGWRVLLADWNLYLESDERTVDKPFEKTLGDLERLIVISQPTIDDGSNAPIAADKFNVKLGD